MTTMGTNKLMKNLAPSDREQLMKAFKKVTFEKDSEIITQGKEGDSFFILYTGQCDISVKGKGTVMKATKGVAFGELALLQGAEQFGLGISTTSSRNSVPPSDSASRPC